MNSDLSLQPFPKHSDLRDLFRQFSPFQVPVYQRAYAWEEEHLEQFVEDLREHPSDTPYYLGHFLLERTGDAGIYVIDGQQRLTTVTLVLGSIIRLLSASAEHQEEAGGLEREFLGSRFQMRFQTVTEDHALLEGLTFDGHTVLLPRGRSQHRLVAAAKWLEAVLSTQSPDTLKRWANCLAKAHVTFFEVRDKVQATQIFTFQNSRGKKLSDFEKLKAFLMQQIYLHAIEKTANQAIRRVEGHFATMYQEMERIILLDENQVLRHHDHAYSAHGGGAVENLKQDLASIPEKMAKVEGIVRYCEALAASFVHVREIELLAQVEEHVADLLILDAGNSWPLLLKLYGIFRSDVVRRQDVLELLRDVEITLFKMEFQHGSVTNNLIARTKQLKTVGDLPELCRDMQVAVNRGFAHNRVNFDSSALEYYKGDYHYHPVTRYVLWKYENGLGLSNDRKVTPWSYLNLAGKPNMQSTLEHVSARHPRAGNNTEEFNARYLNNLGNLVFTPKGMNSTLGNRPESEKQPLLEASSFNAHREIAKVIEVCGEWAPVSILSRKERILKFLRHRWEIAEPQVSMMTA